MFHHAIRMYRAVSVAAPGPATSAVLAIVNQPLRALASSEVLIRIRAIGINPVETYIRSGKYASATFPHTPGHDAAGIVEAVGSGVSRLRVGQSVYTLRTVTGAYAELAIAEERFTHTFPDKLPFSSAAAIPTPYHTAYRALFQRLRVTPGKTLLVHGATGGVGIAALQLAVAHGVRVIATSGSDAGDRLVGRWSESAVRHGTPETKDRILALTNGRGPDFIVEMLGNVNLQLDLELVARGGAICVVGSRGDAVISPRAIMMKECTVTGMMLPGSSDDDVAEQAAHIAAGMRTGALEPQVGRVFEGLESAPAAQVEVIEHAGGAQGKIVITL
jgi:NADPH:quinone reductase